MPKVEIGGGGGSKPILLVLLLAGLGGGWWAWNEYGGAPGAAGPSAAPVTDLAAPGSVAGVVHLRDTTKPAVGVAVRALLRRGEDEWSVLGSTKTGADGRFVLVGLPPGPCRVRPGADDAPPSEVTHADVVVAPSKTADVVLELEPLPEQGTVYCRGTVRFDSGRAPKAFTFRFWEGAGGDMGRYAVAGEEGRFGRRLPKPGAYHVTAMVVEGEPHEYFFKEVQVVEGQPLELVIEELRETAVIVYDAATRQPVEGARVYRNDPKDRATSSHPHAPPGPETLRGKPFATGIAGRCSLGRGRGNEVVWVVAKGYAWSRASVARGSTEDTRVDLAPGGALRVKVPGWGGLSDPYLSAWPLSRDQDEAGELGLPMAFPAPGDDGTVLVEGLLSGRYLLRVHSGPWLQHLVVHGHATVTVVPGDPFDVTVPLTAK